MQCGIELAASRALRLQEGTPAAGAGHAHAHTACALPILFSFRCARGPSHVEMHTQELTELLRPHVIPAPRRYYQWGEAQQPDVWFEPVKVSAMSRVD